MYYRINEEQAGSYLTADNKRVALLSNPKPATFFQKLYIRCDSEEEAIETFGLRAYPRQEDQQ